MNRRLRLPAAIIGLALLLSGLPVLAAEGVVNINTASVEELTLLPRVGETVAQRILQFREENGPFRSAEDLLLVKGIGERTFETMRPYVVVEGATTLAEKVRVERRKTS